MRKDGKEHVQWTVLSLSKQRFSLGALGSRDGR
jgi:hypothetical protein